MLASPANTGHHLPQLTTLHRKAGDRQYRQPRAAWRSRRTALGVNRASVVGRQSAGARPPQVIRCGLPPLRTQ